MTAARAYSATPAELAAIEHINSTAAAFPRDATLAQLLEDAMARHAHARGVVCDHDHQFGTPSLTHAEVNAKANQVARHLRAIGAGPGEVIAVMAERSFAMVLGIFGIIKSGAAYMPIAPDTPPERLRFMTENAGVRVLLTYGARAAAEGFEGTIVDLAEPALYRGDDSNPEHVNSPTDLAYVIYTSGSTGRPKGVMVEHRALINRLHWMQSAYPIDGSDVILQKTPFAFDVSVWELFWWALHGATLCMLAPGAERNPPAIADALRKHGVTVLHFVPSMLNVFLEHLGARVGRATQAMRNVVRVFASGEALSPHHVERFNAIVGRVTPARLTNLYGPTEATVDVSYYDCPASGPIEGVPIGRPIQNLRLHVIRDGAYAALGETGELCIAGVGLARGYVNNPELTNERFVDNPVNPGERIYKTGDVARWREDGTLEFLGREDHQVKIRGLRIELGEIERAICEHSAVAECVAVVERHSENVILIVAYLVCRRPLDAETAHAYLKRRLPEYMIPNRFVTLDEIPLTPNGKADRGALERSFQPAEGV